MAISLKKKTTKKVVKKVVRPKTLEWLSRTLSVAHVPYALCTSQKAFDKELKRLNEPSTPYLLDGAVGTTHYINRGESRTQAIIVCVPLDSTSTARGMYTVLIHEAVHVWQELQSLLGEVKPGKEQEAYGIETIAYRLMTAYDGMCLTRPKD